MRAALFFVAFLVTGGGSQTFVLHAVAGDAGGAGVPVGGSHGGAERGEGGGGELQESATTSRRGVAVCLGGQLRSLRLTLDSFRAYVLEALLAPSPDTSDAADSEGEPGSGEADGEEEALLLLEEGEEEEEEAEEGEQEAEEAEVESGGVVAAPGQKRRRRIAMPDLFVYAPTPSALELAAFAKLMEAANSALRGRSRGNRSATFASHVRLRGVRFGDERFVLRSLQELEGGKILRHAALVKGNWLGSAGQELLPNDRRKGTGIYHMYSHEQCLQMIEVQEDLRGFEYSRLVYSRSDLRWVAPHPPLAVLRPRGRLWVPWAGLMDWGGLYDRHLVMPREAADVILGGWRLLRTGKAVRWLVGVFGEQHVEDINGTNTETWLLVRAMVGQIPVSRFPMTGYVACDHGEWAHGHLTVPATSSTKDAQQWGSSQQEKEREEPAVAEEPSSLSPQHQSSISLPATLPSPNKNDQDSAALRRTVIGGRGRGRTRAAAPSRSRSRSRSSSSVTSGSFVGWVPPDLGQQGLSTYAGRRSKGKGHGFSCRPGVDFRYPGEYREVVRYARCVSDMHESLVGELPSRPSPWDQAAIRRCYCAPFNLGTRAVELEDFWLCHPLLRARRLAADCDGDSGGSPPSTTGRLGGVGGPDSNAFTEALSRYKGR